MQHWNISVEAGMLQQTVWQKRGRAMIVRPGGALALDFPVLVVPGRWQNGNFWAKDDPKRDLRISLAESGVISATVCYRTAGLQGIENHAELAELGTNDLICDIVSAADILVSSCSANRVVVAGYSLGAILACLALPIITLKLQVCGLVLFDGGFGDVQSTIIPNERLVLNPAKASRFTRLANNALSKNKAVSPFALAKLAPHIFDEDELRYLVCADGWWPTKQILEIEGIIQRQSYKSHPLSDYLQSLQVPVLAFGTSHDNNCMEPRAVRTAKIIAGPDASCIFLNGWAHSHVLSHRDAPKRVYRPFIEWLLKLDRNG